MTISPVMVERVARAMFDAGRDWFNQTAPDEKPLESFEECDAEDAACLRLLARAAIEATPLKELVEALTNSREAVASLEEGALGWHREGGWPYRDELLSKIDALLTKVRTGQEQP